MRKKILLLFLSIFLLIVVYWIYNTSFVQISTDNQQGNGISYAITNQRTQKQIEIKDGSNRLKKRVPKASYEIWVKNGDKSYFTVAKARGFLRTVNVKATLQQEHSRKFIGNNPEACMSYLTNVLISYACSDSYGGSTNIHIPATASQPTYTINNPGVSIFGKVAGLVNTAEGPIALVRVIGEGEGHPSGYYIYTVDNSLKSLAPGTPLDSEKGKIYSIRKYQVGFVVYDNSFSQILYYTSTKSKPVNITVDKPKAKDLVPYSLNTDKDTILTFYSSSADSKQKKTSSEVIINKNNQSTHFTFKKQGYSNARLCGSKKLCLLGDKGLDVYDISTSKAKFVFSVTGVAAIEGSSSEFIVVRQNEILNIDMENRSGFSEYSLGDYKYSGISKDDTGYTLSLIDNKNRKVALHIDQNATNSDSIDKKVAQIQKMSGVSLVTIYDKYIYVSAELGPLVYDSTSNGYTYNPDTKKTVSTKINQEVDRLGIDRSVYKITSNAD